MENTQTAAEIKIRKKISLKVGEILIKMPLMETQQLKFLVAQE